MFGLFPARGLAPVAPRPGDRGPEAAAYLNSRLSEWQQRLQLQDWKISLRVSHLRELRPGTLGNIHWDADKKTAVIRVLNPADYESSFSDAVKDMEFTVVHELIHLELSSLTRDFKDRSEESFSKEEQAVNQMAQALLQLDPGPGPEQVNPAGKPAASLAASNSSPRPAR